MRLESASALMASNFHIFFAFILSVSTANLYRKINNRTIAVQFDDILCQLRVFLIFFLDFLLFSFDCREVFFFHGNVYRMRSATGFVVRSQSFINESVYAGQINTTKLTIPRFFFVCIYYNFTYDALGSACINISLIETLITINLIMPIVVQTVQINKHAQTHTHIHINICFNSFYFECCTRVPGHGCVACILSIKCIHRGRQTKNRVLCGVKNAIEIIFFSLSKNEDHDSPPAI